MTITLEKKKVNTYDEVPYESYPYAQSRPDHLRAIGQLFGMNPPTLEAARVLELGCAEGGNIIPHAVKYPKGEFIGVDLSAVQINAGKKTISDLGLKNIELKEMSITDIDESFGKFDYIICHGVISWVPEFVRDKIFDVCSANLSKNGIAYVSYNTLPGWNMVRTIRDMMLYHTGTFENPADKIAQSRALLGFINETLENNEDPYAKFLKSETDLLANQSDHYLRHDHLEEENKQYYFTEFMQEAAKRNLSYLADSSLASMYIGNLPPSAQEKLSEVKDIVRTEQYMDYILNRRFRSTLLCHASTKINRSLDISQAKNFSFSIKIGAEKPVSEIDFTKNEQVEFYINYKKENKLSTSSPYLAAVIYALVDSFGSQRSFDEIVKKANTYFKGNEIAKIEAEFLSNAMMLIMKGYMSIGLESSPDHNKIKTEKPKLTDLAKYQITQKKQRWATNYNHEPVNINDFDFVAAEFYDGKHSHEQILDEMLKRQKENVFNVQVEGKPVTDEEKLKEMFKQYLDDSVSRLSKQLLLV